MSEERSPTEAAEVDAPSKAQEVEEGLKASWEAVRGEPVESPEERIDRQHPGDLVIATSHDRILVRIHPDGQMTFGPEYTPDEAAETLLTRIAVKRVAMEERLTHLSMMEQIVQQVGAADLHYEAMQTAARAEEHTAHDEFMEEIARRNLEARVHQFIEFARGVALARRRGSPTL